MLDADSFTLFRRIRPGSTSSDHQGIFVNAMICRSGKTVSLLGGFFIFYVLFFARSGRAWKGGFGVRRDPFLGGRGGEIKSNLVKDGWPSAGRVLK